MGFRLPGLIDLQETRWLKMVEDCNRTPQTYDEEIAEAICRAPEGYAELFAILLTALQKRKDLRTSEEHPLFDQKNKAKE